MTVKRPFAQSAIAILLIASPLIAQKFEVASIKPGDPASQNSYVMRNPHGRFTTMNASLRTIVCMAYNVRENQLVGAPAWFDSERYNIEALPGNYSAEGAKQTGGAEMNAMIRGLLAERFQLAIHPETREGPIYTLVIGKSGTKFRESTDADTSGVKTSRGKMTAGKVGISILARTLSNQLSRPVVDQTGLMGEYDFKLEWNPDLTPLEDGTVPAGPSLFTAVQEQLGLKLEPGKGPVEVMIVDHIEKPAAN